MKVTLTGYIALAAVVAAASLGSANAELILDEDFQSPMLDNETQLDNGTQFTGWTFNGSGNDWKSCRSDGTADFTGSTSIPNQGVQSEWSFEWAEYDTTHNWGSDDVYSLSLNATEQSQFNLNDRGVKVQIKETVSGFVLWSDTAELPQYDADHDAGDDWSAAQTFNWDFSAASDFSGGSEGSAITFMFKGWDPPSTGGRGAYYDNIQLDVSSVPEPATAGLLGLSAGALWLFRRAKNHYRS